jgi:hypothetical protein
MLVNELNVQVIREKFLLKVVKKRMFRHVFTKDDTVFRQTLCAQSNALLQARKFPHPHIYLICYAPRWRCAVNEFVTVWPGNRIAALNQTFAVQRFIQRSAVRSSSLEAIH